VYTPWRRLSFRTEDDVVIEDVLSQPNLLAGVIFGMGVGRKPSPNPTRNPMLIKLSTNKAVIAAAG
jgi:hypothetical protein